MNKDKLINIANNTMDIIKNGEYINYKGERIYIRRLLQNSIQNSKLYSPKMVNDLLKNDKIYNEEYSVEITSETTLQAAERMFNKWNKNVTILNFASAKHPGGGFLKGSSAQEESITRSSGLYPCISQMKEMYNYNISQNNPLYSDYMIFSPNVPVFKNDEGYLLNKCYTVSVITSPAPNRSIHDDRFSDNDFNFAMKNRIEKIFNVAINHDQKVLVLGAFGCGVFRNSPEVVSKIFKELLYDKKYINCFNEIIFAISDEKNEMVNIFKKELLK